MRMACVCIMFALGLNGCASAETDDLKPLFDEIRMDTSLGVRIEIPALEKALKTATVAFWLKGLADTRPIQNLTEVNRDKNHPDESQKKQEGSDKWEWRVCDVLYYFYERMLLPEGKRKIDHDRFAQPERDEFISHAVTALKELKSTDVPLTGSNGRP